MATDFAASELVGLPGMPRSKRHVQLQAAREGWAFVAGSRNQRRFLAEALPARTREALAHRAAPSTIAIETAALGSDLAEKLTRAPGTLRDAATRRVSILHSLTALISAGVSRTAAIAHVAAEHQESARTIQRWEAIVRGHAEADWAPLLVPRYGCGTRAELCSIHPDAWAWLLSDYLRPSRPAWSACYRRLCDVAEARGWTPLPSRWALQRRFEREVPSATITLRREGAQALERALPSQRRTKHDLTAMGWVNADGHKLDVFARWPTTDGRGRIARPILIAWQDVFSGKILGWRLDETENADAVRLAFADMVRAHGIPDKATVDNGHAFAGQELTGGAVGRHRFGDAQEQIDGLYVAFGIEPHFTKPYNGRAKPIERAWRDLAEEIAKHPSCQGAYTGNRPEAKPADYGSHAIPIAELAALVAREVERHNARPDRKSLVCAGRSFDETFRASIEEDLARPPIRRATEAQLRWLLLPSRPLLVSRLESTVVLLGNRYHAPELIERRGQRVVAKYDPHALHDGVWIFLPGSLEPLCYAPCLAPVGFGDTDAARRDARAKRTQVRALKEAASIIGTTPPRELMTEPGAPPRTKTGKVVAGHFGRAGRAVAPTAPPAERAREKEFLEREFARLETSTG